MTRRPILVLAAVMLALAAAFFVFYEARLLYVTRGLQVIRAGGAGAYVGAAAFPLLALVFVWGARRCWRASRGDAGAQARGPKA